MMAILLVLGGCAAAVPGHIPDRGRPKEGIAGSLLSRTDTSGTFGPRGNYVPSEAERKLDCRRLTGVIRVKLEELRDLTGEKGPTLLTRVTRKGLATAMAGDASRPEGDERRERLRQRIVGLNGLLEEKGCPPVDGGAATSEPETPARR